LGINEFKNQKTNENYNEKDIDIEENVFFEQIHEKLEPSLIQNRSFLNPKFTLKDCAKSIGTNEKYLSSYLNKIHKMNFNTFINYYRVERAKELLHSTDSDKYTIEAIAQMSGFNSKSSFNAVFKKHTGLTPSEFKLNK
jgi:AraC-like DNA-binding protein